MALRRAVRVNSERHQLIDHFGHESLHVIVWRAKIRVRVYFNKPNSEVFIDQKVEAEKLKTFFASIRVHLLFH